MYPVDQKNRLMQCLKEKCLSALILAPMKHLFYNPFTFYTLFNELSQKITSRAVHFCKNCTKNHTRHPVLLNSCPSPLLDRFEPDLMVWLPRAYSHSNKVNLLASMELSFYPKRILKFYTLSRYCAFAFGMYNRSCTAPNLSVSISTLNFYFFCFRSLQNVSYY